jgi:hypothetical protein
MEEDMKFAFALATAATWSVAAFAGSAAQAPTSTAPAKTVTLTGCVESEKAYRAQHDKGRAGVAGTGIGADNEYVLIQASGSNPESRSSSAAAADMTMAYELSGPAEKQLSAFLGKRVELVGTLKQQEIGRSGPTGGPTANAPIAEKIDTDLKLREFDVASVKAASGTCGK